MADLAHLSVTQLTTYLRCPLQYFFRYVCGVKPPSTGAMTLGRVLHETLHDNYKQKVESRQDLPMSDLTDAFSDHWEQEVEGAHFESDEDAGRLKDEGVGLLGVYGETVMPTVQPVEVEKEFLIETEATELPLKGYIDLIDDQGRIIDHKTSRRSFPADAAAKDVQLTAYALAYRTLHGRPEKGVRLDVMVRTKEPKVQQIEATRSQAEIDRFLRLAEQIERGIRGEVYFPNETGLCGACGYREMCEEW